MAQVKTEKRLDLGEHKVGYQWVAGGTPPGDGAPGQWIVRREQDKWVVVFRSLRDVDYTIQSFPLTRDGEKAAKVMALKIVDVAWGGE